jgi:hypothetical protein
MSRAVGSESLIFESIKSSKASKNRQGVSALILDE